MAAYERFSPRERGLMNGAWHSSDIDQAKLDFDKLARLADINAEKTAKNRWGDVKKKVMLAVEKGEIAELTERESILAGLAWQCLKEPMVPNSKKMVELGITKTTKTANNRWNKLKKKFAKETAGTDGNPAASTPTASQSKTPKSSKRKAAQGGDNILETPTKRVKRATPLKRAKQATNTPAVVEEQSLVKAEA